jgi:hypothetical protein
MLGLWGYHELPLAQSVHKAAFCPLFPMDENYSQAVKQEQPGYYAPVGIL